MKHIVLILLGVLIAGPSSAQKKQVNSIEAPGITGTWRLDSIINGSGEKEKDQEDEKPLLSFHPNGRNMIVSIDQEKMMIAPYELLSGKGHTYIFTPGSLGGIMKIVKVSPQVLTLCFSTDMMMNTPERVFLYLSRSSLSLSPLSEKFAGTFAPATNRYRDDPESPSSSLFLNLDKSGEMESVGFGIDKGTWSTDTNTMILELKGGGKTNQFEILHFRGEHLSLHPLNSPEDSLITLEQHKSYTNDVVQNPEIMDERAYEDSVRTVDSLMAVQAMLEAQYNSKNLLSERLSKNWKAIAVFDSFPGESKPFDGSFRLQISPNGTFVSYSNGKNYTGTWELAGAQGDLLVLSIKGKEQLAYIHYSEYWEGYSETPQIIISLTRPGTEKMATYEMEEETLK